MRREKAVPIAALLLLCASFHVVAAPLTILYTNDLHLRFNRLGSIERLIEAERELNDPVLLLDAGDAWQDTRDLHALVWGADEMVAWMNRVGYDAMALGNHELYWGADRLDQLVGMAEFPVLCANLVAAQGYGAPFVSSARLDVGELRVQLLGVVTGYHLPYPDFPWLRHISPLAGLQQEMAQVGDAFDLLIVVGHVSIATALEIVASMPQIDLFVTGHSHEETDVPIRVGDTTIVQAGAFARKLGRLRLDVADGAASVVANELLSTETASVERDRGRTALLGVALALLAATLLVLF